MSLVVFPRQFVTDVNGTPRVGAKANFYRSGTVDPIEVWKTSAYDVPHQNPVLSVGGGLFPTIYIDPVVNETYKMVITDSADVPITNDDNIPTLGLTQSDLGRLLFPQTDDEEALTITPASTVVDVTDYTNVMRYVSNTIDAVNSQASAFQSAFNIAKRSGRSVTVPAPPSGAAYVLDAPVDATISLADTASGENSRGFTVRGEGNQLAVTDSATVRPMIIARHTGHVFDCTGSYGINFENLSVGTDNTTYPKTCFFWARNSTASGSMHRLSKCRAFGKFSESILYNYGAEEDIVDGCQFSNREGGANAKVLTYTANNYRSLTSSFVPIATGQQSTIAHVINGGSFQNFTHHAAADVLYVEAINLLRVLNGHWFCADSTGGGRSLVYVDTTNGASNEMMLLGMGGEVSSPACPTYGVYIGDAVATCAGLIFESCRFPNATNSIKSHANVTLQTTKFRNITNASSGGGIDIAGTLTDSDHFGQAGAFSVGTYKQNNIIARNGEAAMSLVDNSAAAGKKNWRHRSVAGQYVVALYADDGVTNLGNAIVVTTTTGLTVTNVSLAAGSYSLLVAGLQDFADDAAAAAGSVPVGNLYRTTSTIKVRVA